MDTAKIFDFKNGEELNIKIPHISMKCFLYM